MEKLNVKSEWFKDIYSNHFEEYDRTKKHYYQKIMEIENCLPENTYIYGDSENSDLKPARELGANLFNNQFKRHKRNCNSIFITEG